MSPPPRWTRRKPPWWPAEEPWPPHGPPSREASRWMVRRLVWRMGCLLLLLLVLVVGGCTVAFWLTATATGAVQVSPGLAATTQVASVGLLVLGLAGLLVIGRAVRHITTPMREFMDAVARVADGDYSARVSVRGPGEARALGKAFNAMAQRLEASEAQRRSLLADVTHELRTPLTVMQAHLEGVLDGVYPADAQHLGPILDEMRVLGRLIDDLRTLALAESGALALQREPTDLGVLAADAVAAFRAEADAAEVRLELAVADDLPLLNVDPVRLREVLTNLVANALRYTPRGGLIRLAGAGRPDGGGTLSVSDTGPGIPAEALPLIFDRFYKSGDSRGMGLGLAIARNLILAHGGEIRAESTPGAGTTITIELPDEAAS